MLWMMLTLCLEMGVQGPGAPSPAQGTAVWAVDFVKSKPGALDDYLAFVNANWKAVREEMRRGGGVEAFQVLTEPGGADWDVLLMTKYRDRAAYEAREDLYQAAVARIRPNGAGPTLINGKGARDLAEVRQSRVLTEPRW